MYKLSGLLLFAIIIASCNSVKNTPMDQQLNTLTMQESAEGWTMLFDGTTTKGWHTYGYNGVEKGWKVENGTLHLDVLTMSEWPKNESKDLLTNEEYDNFSL